MSDTPPASMAETIDWLIPMLIGSTITPVIEAGGSVSDALNLAETVAAGVLALTTNGKNDESVIQTFTGNLRWRLAMLRLASAPAEGSA